MQIKLSKISHRDIYVVTLIVLAISLPLSPFITSVSQFVLALNWLIERDFKTKLNRLKQSKGLWAISVVFLVHVVGLIYTRNFNYAFHDLKIKLPILILPVIIGSTQPLNQKEIDKLLRLFIWAVFSATLISFGIFLGIGNYEYTDIRGISIIISHIRFSLYIVLSIVFISYFLLSGKITKSKYIFVYIMLIVWFIFKLILFQSLTGTIILYFLLIYFSYLSIKYKLRKALRIGSILLISIITITTFSFIYYAIHEFYNLPEINAENLETHTPDGNRYYHNISRNELENGNHTWLYVCQDELRKEWNKRSHLNYDSTDNKGQLLNYTIIRYLTSKGLRKDAKGIKSLTNVDIKNIENGIANYLYAEDLNFYARVYQTIWEVNNYISGGNPSQHSVTQRLEFLRAGIHIIKKNPIIGIGTGDVADNFKNIYTTIDTPITYAIWKRAHNQYITFILTFGVLGFLIIITAFIYPILKRKANLHFIVISYIIIFFLSMINEDTLETQAGATFFAYFFTFLLHHNHYFQSITYKQK